MDNRNLSREATIAAGQYTREEKYWLNRLAGDPAKSHFPYDHDPKDQNGKTDHLEFRLSGELWDRVMKIASGSDVRLHMLLVTGMFLLLEKYTLREDLVLGIPIYKQEEQVDFINTVLAVRQQVPRDITFKQLLTQVRESIIEASENQNYPIETLVYQLGMTASPTQFPLFDVALLLEGIHDPEYIRNIPLNMVFSFRKSRQCLEAHVEFNPGLFRKSTVKQVSAHFQQLLQCVLFQVNLNLDAVDILSESEKRQLLVEFNDTRTAYPGDRTIHELFEAQAGKTPGNNALVGPSLMGYELADDSAPISSGETLSIGMEEVSYAELNEKSDRLATGLREKGVGPDTIVGIMVERSVEMVIGMVAVLKAGGAYLPLDPVYPAQRLKYMLSDGNVEILLTSRGAAEIFDGTDSWNGRLCFLRQELSHATPSGTSLPAHPGTTDSPSQLAYVIYTSGSTGRPRGVAVEHRSITNTLLWRQDFYGFDSTDTVLQLPSFSFDSSVEDIFTPLISGSKLVLVCPEKRFSLDHMETLITRYHVTHFLIVPSFYKSFLSEISSSLADVKTVTVAGDRSTGELVKEHFEKVPHIRLYNEYGPTENSVCSTVYKFVPGKTDVLVGKPLCNTYCFILDDGGKLNPMGVAGELCVAGAGLARGYLNNPELTVQKFTTNPYADEFVSLSRRKSHHHVEPEFRYMRRKLPTDMYHTGDLARWLPDGNIELLGRIDHQVKIRGYRIEPEGIEKVIRSFPKITEAVVLARDTGTEETEKYLCAYLVADEPVDIPQLKLTLAEKLPQYMVPACIMQLDTMPLNTNGKIDRKALPEPQAAPEDIYVAPRNAMEEKLAVIWAQVLGKKKDTVGIITDFFEMGGHSLKMTILAARIHKAFNVKISLENMFENPTIKGMVRFIKESGNELFSPIETAEKREYYALSPAQKRLYVLDRMNPDSTAYNLPQAHRLDISIDEHRLENTFKKMVQRHESLRTSFHVLMGNTVQRIHPDAELGIRYAAVTDLSEAVDRINSIIRPFDLSRAPLMRVAVLRLGTHCILVLDMHHIISDGVSREIFVKEFLALYNGESLPPRKLQYKDYAVWQNSDIQQESLKRQESYWLNLFQGKIPVPELPTDFDRPPEQNFEGATFAFEIKPGSAEQLVQLAARQNTTIYMLLLAVYNVFLARLCNSEDIVVGAPVACRTHDDLQQIIGMFVNTLALRNFPSGVKSFSDFLADVKKLSLKAFQNQEYPFDQLVENVSAVRDNARSPLFDVAFILQNQGDGTGKIDGEALYKNTIAKFDLTLIAIQIRERIIFNFQYRTSLYTEETIEKFVRYFETIIDVVLENPDITIVDIQLLSREESDKISVQIRESQKELPEEINFSF